MDRNAPFRGRIAAVDVREGQPDKICASCGRRMEWRRAWARVWTELKFCSSACRSHRPGPRDAELEHAILALLAARARGASICPSEAARAVAGDSDWRALMAASRAAARRLAARGALEITQGGVRVDPSSAKGPIRLRRV